MPWGKKDDKKKPEKAEAASNLWVLEAGFRNLWTISSVTEGEYVLKSRSVETHGYLNMTLRINRRNGNAVCTAEWNSPEGKRAEPKPKPVNLNVTLTLKKGQQTKRLKF